jgi:hypothetical protein
VTLYRSACAGSTWRLEKFNQINSLDVTFAAVSEKIGRKNKDLQPALKVLLDDGGFVGRGGCYLLMQAVAVVSGS